MLTNVGNKERIARVLAGLAILKSANSKKMKAVGLMPLVSGATGHCPCYSMMGINTAKSSSDSTKNDSKKASKGTAEDKSTLVDSVVQKAETLKETVQEKAATLKETAQEKIEELAEAKKADDAEKADRSEAKQA